MQAPNFWMYCFSMLNRRTDVAVQKLIIVYVGKGSLFVLCLAWNEPSYAVLKVGLNSFMNTIEILKVECAWGNLLKFLNGVADWKRFDVYTMKYRFCLYTSTLSLSFFFLIKSYFVFLLFIRASGFSCLVSILSPTVKLAFFHQGKNIFSSLSKELRTVIHLPCCKCSTFFTSFAMCMPTYYASVGHTIFDHQSFSFY